MFIDLYILGNQDYLIRSILKLKGEIGLHSKIGYTGMAILLILFLFCVMILRLKSWTIFISTMNLYKRKRQCNNLAAK